VSAAPGPAITLQPDAARVRTARWGVLGLFWLMGVLLATFLSRVPSITELLDVTTGRFAILMLTGAVGAFLALLVTGYAVARLGTRAVLWWSTFGYLGAFAIAAVAIGQGNQLWFAIGQFFVSFMFAFTNVSINSEAANVERWVGKAIMPHFHASFSVGMAMGLALGALVSHFGVGPTAHFLVVAVALTVVRLALIKPSVVDGAPQLENLPKGIGGPFKTARKEYSDRRILMIGLIVFAASTIEGAAATWSSLAIVQGFSTSEAVGDIFYWVFLVAMVSTRGLGAQIIGTWGRVMSLRISAVLVAVGVLLFAFGPSFTFVGVGMVLWGLGAGLGVPIGFSAASDDPKRAAARVAAVSSFATIAGLVMPQVIGQLGNLIPLREALTVVVGAAILSFLIARAVRAEGPLLRSHKAIARKARLAADAEADRAAVVVADGVEPVQAPLEER
jgi:MFS family permease